MIWNLNNIRGQREAVKLKLQAEKELPEQVKAFLSAQVDSMDPDVTGCKVDAYAQDNHNRSASTVTRNISISIVGFKL